MGLPGRLAGQERRRRRHPRRRQSANGNRGLLARLDAKHSVRESWRARIGCFSSIARVRIHERRVKLHAIVALRVSHATISILLTLLFRIKLNDACHDDFRAAGKSVAK